MVIGIVSLKGGVGKTTTAQAILNGSRKLGLSTLGVDMDPQGNLTFGMGLQDPASEGKNIPGTYQVLKGETTIKKAIRSTPSQGKIVPSWKDLAAFDTSSPSGPDLLRLSEQIGTVRDKYDVIVIDTRPGILNTTFSALLASDSVIIPLCPDTYSVQGFANILDEIGKVKNAKKTMGIGELTIAGILLTRTKPRQKTQAAIANNIRIACKQLGLPVFKTEIQEGTAIVRAAEKRRNLFTAAGSSIPVKQYMELINELNLVKEK